MASRCEHLHRVGAFHDGELPEKERRRLEEHIRQCPVCARELEQLRSLSRFLAAASMPAMPDSALERLHRRVRGAREAVVVRLAGALTMAAAAVLVACSVWLWHAERTLDSSLGLVPEWETAAVAGQADTMTAGDAEVRLAAWIVQDLSQENGDG